MILYAIEGAKGSGKSTLAQQIAGFTRTKVHAFEQGNYVTKDVIDHDSWSSETFIHDRGLLSFSAYGFSRNYKPIVETQHLMNETIYKTWAPLTMRDYEYWLDSIKEKLIILYSSDPELLVKRIKGREKFMKKGATQDEYQELAVTNEYFLRMGQLLKFLRPEKVELIDIATQINELAKYHTRNEN
jgi:adenylate kinase family enzyme